MEGAPRDSGVAEMFEKMALPALVISILLTGYMVSVVTPLPSFTTDLDSFSPESASDLAEERVDSVIPPTGHRIYIHVSPADGEGNVLEVSSLQDLLSDMEMIDSLAGKEGGIYAHVNAADVVNRAILERSPNSGGIGNFSDWSSILDSLVSGDETCIDAVGDDKAISAASFASSAMLHTDFEYEHVCECVSRMA